MEHDCISIGFGEDIDFSRVSSRAEIRDKYREAGIELSGSMDFNISAIERFVIWMKPGQLVFVSHGTKKLRAIGEIVGDYYFEPNPEIRYNHFRKVKWLYKDLDIPIKNIYGKLFSQQTIYQIDPAQLKYEEYFSKTKPVSLNSDQNYVIIIDEINRGNVSAVFGELITLIEPDKRLGEKEEIILKLPYSRAEFGIPNNLYIIGTMNTADRSVEALDTALRRRFSFEEMTPKPEKLTDKEIAGINLGHLLRVINERVELLVDRDHTIGHSYFMNSNLNSPKELATVFNDKVVPLLQEYFYGDFGKIGLVLGAGFIKKNKNNKAQFAEFEYENQEDFKNDTYSLIRMTEDTIIDALKVLLRTKESEQETQAE
jgi:5-methylcytosine-specific restriction protein B